MRPHDNRGESYLMGQVSASSSVLIDAEPQKVLAAVADYNGAPEDPVGALPRL